MRAYLRVVHDVREELAIDRSGIPRRAVGAGAPSGLQNRRETSRSPVRSIRTALRHIPSYSTPDHYNSWPKKS